MFFIALVLFILRLFKLKTEGQTEDRKPQLLCYKTQSKLSLILG